jgi:hypothetical protein
VPLLIKALEVYSEDKDRLANKIHLEELKVDLALTDSNLKLQELRHLEEVQLSELILALQILLASHLQEEVYSEILNKLVKLVNSPKINDLEVFSEEQLPSLKDQD